MIDRREEFIDRLAGITPAPDGVDHETNVIAKVPPTELGLLLRANAVTYEGLVHAKHEDPEQYDFLTKNPHPIPQQVEQIKLKQQNLSRFKRRSATILAASTLAVGGFLGGYSMTQTAKQEGQQNLPQLTKQADDHGNVLGGSIIGICAGALGGFAASMSGLALSGRLAYKPAQKIVRKAEAIEDHPYRA